MKDSRRTLPAHIAFIVDGNRRWAKKRGLPVVAGHKHVMDKVLDEIVFYSIKLGIPYVTFWAFSTENWKRGKKFASMLFRLMRQGMQSNIDKYNKAGIRLNTIGDLSKLPKDLVKTIKEWQQKSKDNKKITVTIALNYGGRDEIVRTVNKIIFGQDSPVQKKKKPQAVSEQVFAQYLDTAEPKLPDIDLVVRTGGEQRTSGFMPWQTDYAEWFFLKTLMPDFTIKEFNKILAEYQKRDRRMGGDSKQK